ncbi:MAG: hypothetical protein ACTSUQ_06210 [Candidatus Freyarchaeota archaeon]
MGEHLGTKNPLHGKAGYSLLLGFGAKLELYQDEENTGRQYSTPVGNIDLLAINRSKKEFVIIELKKGKEQRCSSSRYCI